MFGSTSVCLAFCRLLLFAVVGSLYAAGPTFEVASVKASPPLTMERYGDPAWRPAIKIDPTRVTFRNQSLLNLICFAWRVKDYEVVGPEWMEQSRFEIVAGVPKGVPTEAVPEMLQALLIERFKLTLHPQAKELTGSSLVVKDAAKLVPKPPDLQPQAKQHLDPLEPQTMEQVVRVLSVATDGPVIDRTGLEGDYMVPIADLLKAAVEHKAASMSAVLAAKNIKVAEPEIDVAAVLQKCGLKLETHKLSTTVLVVDSVQKTPVEN